MSLQHTRTTRPPLSKLTGRLRAAVAVATLLLVGACSSDSITSPNAMPASAQIGKTSNIGATDLLTSFLNQFLSYGLQRITPLANDVVVTATIGNAGGTIVIPETGLTLVVPKGAIGKTDLTITVTALAGNTIAYEFEPHGTKFAKPLSVIQSLDGTRVGLFDVVYTLRGGYFKDIRQVDLKTGKAKLDEIYPVLLLGRKASFNITHFSGYMVSMD